MAGEDAKSAEAVKRYGGDTGREWGDSWPWVIRWLTGVILTVNFVIFWAVPIFGQGQAWKQVLCRFFRPIYQYFDNNKSVRAFAAKYIYARPVHADFFTNAVMILFAWGVPLIYIIKAQLAQGYLTWWQIYLYNFAWVGFGGRVMGGAYTFAHKEGHNPALYKPWIANSVGNIFENWIGSFFGNVPYNFTTSHIYVHHRLNAGTGDTFYQWDLDRTSWVDFMIFLHRITLHTTGLSSLYFFIQRKIWPQALKLTWGIIVYWGVIPLALWSLTKSWSFLFFIYLQPQICMTFFLAFMNFAFHAFIDFDEDGHNIWCVNSTTIIEGDDDYFGEDDHMAHHFATHVYWRDLTKHRDTKLEDFKKYHAAVFRGLSIVELAAFILFKDYKSLAKHYVQYNDGSQSLSQFDKNAIARDGSVNLGKGSLHNGKRNQAESEALIKAGSENLSETWTMSKWNYTGRLTEDEIIAMLKSRAQRREPLREPYPHSKW